MHSEITLSKVVHPNMLTCAPDTPVVEAARSMSEQHCSSILIEDQDQIVGIWTERDALALDIGDPDFLNLPISRFMSSPVKTISINTRIEEAALRFREENIRHFLVVDRAGRRKGIISQTDIVVKQNLAYYLTLREVNAVFNRNFRLVPGTLPALEVIRAMRQEGLDAILVDGAELGYGILTERDVICFIGSGKTAATVAELASFPLISVTAHSSLYQARKKFLEHKVRHLGVTGSNGKLLGLIAFSDILANIEFEYVHQLQDALQERNEILAISNRHLRLAAKAFESTFEGIMVTNAEQVIESVNPAFTMITNFKAHEVIGKTPAILASGRHDQAFYQAMHESLSMTGHWQGEIWNRRRSGEIFVEWLTINAVMDDEGEVCNYVAVFSDITTRKMAEQRMHFLAHHDALTSLPNRALLTDRLQHAISHAQRNDTKVALVFLDLNDFKLVNDTIGHHAGDHMLQVVAQRLVACVRAEDTVARMGGDEFILLMEEINNQQDVPPIVGKMIAALSQPMLFEGREMSISASIGISFYPEHGALPEELIKNADAAMYKAKAKGKNVYFVFDDRMVDSVPQE